MGGLYGERCSTADEGRYVTGGGALGRTYDVSPDGQRFLKIKAPETEPGAAPPALIVGNIGARS